MYCKEYSAYFMFSSDMGPTQQLNQTEPSVTLRQGLEIFKTIYLLSKRCLRPNLLIFRLFET